MSVVSKFGGTSMGDANAMRASAKIAADRKSAVVVVSATSGTTNLLIELGQVAEKGNGGEFAQQVTNLLQKLSTRHEAIANDLQCSSEVKLQIHELLREVQSLVLGIQLLRDCSAKAMDTLMSFGERLSSLLFVQALRKAVGPNQAAKVQWLDVRTVLKTDSQFGQARPLTDQIATLCQALPRGQIWVTQGFIGETESGFTTTLGRGGSDYSAAILAEAFAAKTLEIWTDVPGIATTDPRLVPHAQSIPEISFTEASELATFGAKVLHPATLLPALRQNIPVFIGSTFAPAEPGTWVRLEVANQPLVRALALRRKQALVTITTPEMLQAFGFLQRIFKVFGDHKVSVDSITTSEIGVAVTVDAGILQNRKLIDELAEIGAVSTEENLCLVSVIGNNINHTPGLAHQIFAAVNELNVRMICLGASRHNFCFVVSEEHGPVAVQRLHKKFCERD